MLFDGRASERSASTQTPICGAIGFSFFVPAITSLATASSYYYVISFYLCCSRLRKRGIKTNETHYKRPLGGSVEFGHGSHGWFLSVFLCGFKPHKLTFKLFDAFEVNSHVIRFFLRSDDLTMPLPPEILSFSFMCARRFSS